MAKAQHKAMRAPKVSLRKLRTERYVFIGQGGERHKLQELGLVIDAVPSGGLGEILFNKLIQQRKEIREFLASAGYAIDEMASLKQRKPISFRISYLEVEREAESLPKRLRANVQNVYIVLSDKALSDACSANKEAIEEMCKGHIERSIEHYIRAERSIGAALALAQVGKVVSTIARAKGKSRHSETDVLRGQVIACWHKEFEPKLSAEKVAEELVGRFCWENSKFVSHRTIAKWLSAEKKKHASRN